MKRYFLSLIAVIITLGFYSCNKCVTCTISDNSVVVVNYPEFCGTSSEAKALEQDVIYDASSLQCVTCYILSLSRTDTIKAYEDIYGMQDELDEFIDNLEVRAIAEGGIHDCEPRRTNSFAEGACD